MHFASTILMVRPASFGFNEQTAVNNAFQQRLSPADIQHKVLKEFDGMVASIRSAGVEVIVLEDTAEPPKPDAIFPNNWFCTLSDGSLALFPMFATNRRQERRKDIIDKLMHDFKVTELEDWTAHEDHYLYLEGTGSMVMDHANKIIYACLSERTNALLLHQFGERIGYEVISFNAKDKTGLPVYHTNVMMCIGNGFCLACDEIIDGGDIDAFLESINKTKTKLISIRYDQVLNFAGNMLQLQNQPGEYILVMSRSAFDSLDNDQKETLEEYTRLLPVDIKAIETIGGGSARCMMAEIFLLPVTK
jgi:hypothetical protein